MQERQVAMQAHRLPRCMLALLAPLLPTPVCPPFFSLPTMTRALSLSWIQCLFDLHMLGTSFLSNPPHYPTWLHPGPALFLPSLPAAPSSLPEDWIVPNIYVILPNSTQEVRQFSFRLCAGTWRLSCILPFSYYFCNLLSLSLSLPLYIRELYSACLQTTLSAL